MKSICVGCGMCCDGTMYRTVEVRGDDPTEFLERAGLLFSTKDDVTAFRQPCPVSSGGCCTAYEHRPSVCRAYRCLLLRRYEAGEVDYDDASALIARTTALRDRVRPALTAYVAPDAPQALEGLYRLMTAKFDAMPDPAAGRREHAALLLEIGALRVLLSREFEPQDSKTHQPDAAPGQRSE